MGDYIMHEKDIQKTSLRQKMVFVLVQVFLYLFLLVMAVVVLFPFYWMIISSLKTLDEYRMSVPTFFPRRVMFSNYLEAFSSANLGRLFLNTLYVGVVSTILSLASPSSRPLPLLVLSLQVRMLSLQPFWLQ